MERMDAATAAARIRGHLDQPTPEDWHTEKFAKEILDNLGMEHSLCNMAMVVKALHTEGVEPHLVQEYPKWVKNHTGEQVMVQSEAEESEAQTAPPEPAEPAEPAAEIEPEDEQPVVPESPEYDTDLPPAGDPPLSGEPAPPADPPASIKPKSSARAPTRAPA